MVLGFLRWALALCVVLSGSAGAQPAGVSATYPLTPLTADSPVQIDIGANIAYLLDDSRQLQLEQAMAEGQPWLPVARTAPNFGFTHNAYWFRLVLDNRTGKALPRILELPRPFLDDVRLFHLVEGRVVSRFALGDEQPFAQRAVRHPNFVMPLMLEPGRNLLVMRVASSGTVEAPLRLWEPAAFHEASGNEYLMAGAIFGMLVVMIVYNLFVYLSTRDINYLYYIFFVASYLVFWGTLNGYAFAYLWPEAIRWNSIAVPIGIAGACLSASLFADSFLKLKRHSLLAHRLMQTMAWVSLCLMMSALVVPYSWVIRVTSGFILVVSMAALSIGYWRWWQGARYARFYCLSWTALFVGVGVLTINKFGWLPSNFLVDNASQIGILLLVVLLSFTLADRINTDRSLRLHAQSVALAHAQKARTSQQALLTATADANRALEERVHERTNELNLTLDQLRLANEQLQRLSMTDSLTQIGNRAFFDHSLVTEHKRASRLKQPLALMLMDIDHFKAINDTYGHPAGDACLRALAHLMRQQVQRAGDLLARYGGEEFVVLLINSTLGDALELAEEFRADIAALEVPFEGRVLRFTASFGVASAVPDMLFTPSQLVGDADRALYEAKHSGRNCVRAAAPRLRKPAEPGVA
ncbi:diguanylate cyclase [Rhodoferax sp.]|uniref:sensor domain-containing diguanylate cyclase n=1 Tax=Rhodoferax sp. TaxID=50421 RepID=UPI0025DC3637|nr:diguanylate cyclase [Rhodoferax sp.]